MNYKKMIIEMVKKMENEDYLQNIFYFVKVMFEKEKSKWITKS